MEMVKIIIKIKTVTEIFLKRLENRIKNLRDVGKHPKNKMKLQKYHSQTAEKKKREC